MITFFTGTPGSGKTYEAVEKILEHLSKGKKVYTNIDGMEDPLCHEAIKSVCNLKDNEFNNQFHHLGFDKEKIQNFWNHCEEESLIVIDECQKFFSNREWQTEKNKEFGDWASTHRHHGYDLLIITQNAERVDSAVRALTEWNYVYRKVNFFGGAVQKKYLVYSYAGDETSGAPISKNVRTYNPKIFLCYKSYVSDDIKEQAFMNHVNVLKHPIFYAIPVVFALCIYMVFFKSSIGTGDVFGTAAVQAKKLASVETAEASIIPQEETIQHDEPTTKNRNNRDLEELGPEGTEHRHTSRNLHNSKFSGNQITDDRYTQPPQLTKRIKLNTISHFVPGQKVKVKILFDGAIYFARDFPFKLHPSPTGFYADIPLEYIETMNNPQTTESSTSYASKEKPYWNTAIQ